MAGLFGGARRWLRLRGGRRWWRGCDGIGVGEVSACERMFEQWSLLGIRMVSGYLHKGLCLFEG